jgi:Membrane bound beta barrel domain (DUF5777)
MRLKKGVCLLLLLLGFSSAFAQDDLMKDLENESSGKKEVASAAFKGLQICNMQSTKLAGKGEFYVLISHRFGDLTHGLDNFFGLDDAHTKIGGLYGITNWATIGFSRQTPHKIYELTAKYKLANQEVNGFPITIVGYNTMNINTELKTAEFTNFKGSYRLAYTAQLLVSRKFSEKFSVEINPIYVRKNLIDRETENKNQALLAFGTRYKISKRMSLNLEYANRFNPPANKQFNNPISLGLDIETGGHVFQLTLSTSQDMNDVSYFTNTLGKLGNNGGIFFGFNMYRVF